MRAFIFSFIEIISHTWIRMATSAARMWLGHQIVPVPWRNIMLYIPNSTFKKKLIKSPGLYLRSLIPFLTCINPLITLK